MLNRSLGFAKHLIVNKRAESIITGLLKRNGSSSAGGDKRHPPEYLDVAQKYDYPMKNFFFLYYAAFFIN